MARSYYPGDNLIVAAGAGSPAAIVMAPAAEFTVWSAETGGSQYTDLLAADGSTPLPVNGNGKPYCDSNGVPPGLWGPDNIADMLWRDMGTGRRFPMLPSNQVSNLLVNGVRKNVATTISGNMTLTGATAFSTTPTVSGNAMSHLGNLGTQMATSSVMGAYLNAAGQPYWININSSTGLWPNSGSRTIPTGFTGQVWWNSTTYPGASKPTGMIDGDVWFERIS